MKKLIVGLLAAWMIMASAWAAPREETARQDKHRVKTLMGVYEAGAGDLIPMNVRLNDTGDIIVDGDTNTFTVAGVSLDAIEVAVEAIEGASNTMVVHQAAIEIAVEAIEGASNTIVANQEIMKLQLGVIEGNGTTTVANQELMKLQLGVIEGNGTTSVANEELMKLQLGVIEGNGTTSVANEEIMKLQLGVIEGNGTTGVARLGVIEGNGTTAVARLDTALLQLGVIEGNGTTGTAAMVSIDGKMVDGTDIGDVTVNNAAAGAAVNIQDGGNTITVDGTVGISSAVTIASPVGGGAEATAVRVTVANDSTGVLGVEGLVAEGAAVSGTDPFLIAGVSGGNVDTLNTDGGGYLALGKLQASSDNRADASYAGWFRTTNNTGFFPVVRNYLFDGTAWDRPRGDSVGGAWMQGGAADGAAAAGNPLQTGGVDTNGDMQSTKVCLDGSAFTKTTLTPLDKFEATTGFSAINDAGTIATNVIHLQGTVAVGWAKAGSNVDSAIQKTITETAIPGVPTLQLLSFFYIVDATALSDIEYAYMRIGEDNANYLEFQIAAADLAVGWNTLVHPMVKPASQTGNGLSSGTIKWIAIGCVTDDAGDTIDPIIADVMVLASTNQNVVLDTPATDVDLGNVAIKDGNSNTRADVEIDGSKKALHVMSNSMAAETGGNLDDIATDTGTIDGDTSIIAGAVAAGQMQVDVVAELPAGTQQIGKFAIADGGAQTADIGDGAAVDYLYVRLTDGTDSSSLDGSGNLEVVGEAGGGVKVTLDGETVELAAGTAEIGTLGANSGTDVGDVTINNAAAGAAVNVQDGGNSLTIDAQELTDIETAVQVLDDWDATHDGAASADGPQLMAAYDSTKPTAVGDGDAVRALSDSYGRLLPGVEPERNQATITSADATGATQVIAKTAGKKIYILSLVVSTDTAMNIQFQDDTGPTVLMEQMYFSANGGVPLVFPESAPLVVNTNEDFDVITSVAGNISVTVTYYLAP